MKDVTRVMSRLKAVYRSCGDPLRGTRRLTYTRHRGEWLPRQEVKEAGVRRRAEQLYQQLDMLQHLRQQARRELLAESRETSDLPPSCGKLPALGPIRSALAVALDRRLRIVSVPDWAYERAGLETHTSGDTATSRANCVPEIAIGVERTTTYRERCWHVQIEILLSKRENTFAADGNRKPPSRR